MDVLSSVLREMRFESAGYRRLELRAPWGIAFEQAGLRGIHIVVRGRCELLLEDGSVHALATGDLVVTPRADPHVLRSPGLPRVRPVPAGELARHGRRGKIRAGGTGEPAAIVCGAFVFHEADHPALQALPRLIHVPAGPGRTPRWLAAYVEALQSEATDPGPGSDVVLARLSSALVAKALRFHARDAVDPGWLRGLQDRHVARALGALHDGLERRWSLVSLARVAGLSRAAFAARFAQSVGETPMRYLLRCRMGLAMRLLQQEGVTLARIAGAVGYASEAALSTAFKRHAGVSPRAYKRGDRA